MVAEIGEHGVQEIRTLSPCQPDIAQLLHVAGHHPVEYLRMFGRKHQPVLGHHGAEQPLADVEPAARQVFVAGIESQEGAQTHQKPEVEIGHSLLQGVERHHRPRDEIEQGTVGLHLPDQTVEHLGHKERNGALADIERKRRQRHRHTHLLHAVHLPARRLQPLELHEEHRLEKGALVALAPHAADALHQIVLAPQQIGQQIDHQRTVAVLHGMEHDPAGLVTLHPALPMRNAPSEKPPDEPRPVPGG